MVLMSTCSLPSSSQSWLLVRVIWGSLKNVSILRDPIVMLCEWGHRHYFALFYFEAISNLQNKSVRNTKKSHIPVFPFRFLPAIPIMSFIAEWSKPGWSVAMDCSNSLISLSLEEFHNFSVTLPALIFLNLWQLPCRIFFKLDLCFLMTRFRLYNLTEESPRLSLLTVSYHHDTQCLCVPSLVITLITCWRFWSESTKVTKVTVSPLYV